MPSIQETRLAAQALIAEAGLTASEASLDADVLLAHCLGKPRSYLYTWPERELSDADAARCATLVARRQRGEPVAYLVGYKEFWSLPLRVTPDTLIPRPETEDLVAWALELPIPESAAVADWGTGSGAIALALARERPQWGILAADQSAAALTVAKDNAAALGLKLNLLESDWGEAFAAESLGLIVSNPPYVAPGDPHLVEGDVRYEPATALVADSHGLADIWRIIGDAWRVLSAGGYLLLEHGYDQRDSVRRSLKEAGFGEISSRTDLAGIDRMTGGRKP